MQPTIISCSVATTNTTQAARAIRDQLLDKVDISQVRGGVVYATVDLDLADFQRQLSRGLPGVPFIGASSCAKVATDAGLVGPGVGAIWFTGDGFHFGVAADERLGDSEALGRQLLSDAVDAAGITASETRFVIVHTTPGQEERFIRGVYGQLDSTVPIIGGSAADNDISGKWSIFSNHQHATDGAVVAVCDWPWKMGLSFQSGYLVTKQRGVVTRADERSIREIDHRPAAEVYNEWLDGALDDYLQSGGNVLEATTLSPLGVPRGQVGGLDAYVLVHPEQVLANHSLTTFADVQIGDTVAVMRSTRKALIQRGGKVANWALEREGLRPENLAGGLIIYCAGCMLAIQQELDQMLSGVQQVVQKAPFVMPFTFGELGCVYPRRYDHGNLMLGVLMLSTTQATPV